MLQTFASYWWAYGGVAVACFLYFLVILLLTRLISFFIPKNDGYGGTNQLWFLLCWMGFSYVSVLLAYAVAAVAVLLTLIAGVINFFN